MHKYLLGFTIFFHLSTLMSSPKEDDTLKILIYDNNNDKTTLETTYGHLKYSKFIDTTFDDDDFEYSEKPIPINNLSGKIFNNLLELFEILKNNNAPKEIKDYEDYGARESIDEKMIQEIKTQSLSDKDIFTLLLGASYLDSQHVLEIVLEEIKSRNLDPQTIEDNKPHRLEDYFWEKILEGKKLADLKDSFPSNFSEERKNLIISKVLSKYIFAEVSNKIESSFRFPVKISLLENFTLVIPENVKEIGNNFLSHTELSPGFKLILPQKLEKIGNLFLCGAKLPENFKLVMPKNIEIGDCFFVETEFPENFTLVMPKNIEIGRYFLWEAKASKNFKLVIPKSTSHPPLWKLRVTEGWRLCCTVDDDGSELYYTTDLN